MAQKKVPFRKWVPLWLRAVVGFTLLVPIMMLNGAYTGSSLDASSALGILSEDINMAYYAASAGMAVAYPIIPKIRACVTTKTVLLCDLFLQVVLSWLCTQFVSMQMVIAMSFLIGFLKAFALLEMIIILKPIFSKKDIRSEFYAYFYPIVFGTGQISMLLTAEFAYNYQWQYMYYFVMAMLLVAIIAIMICFRYGSRPIRIPLREIDGVNIMLISAILLMTVYVCTYGKVRDWFASSDIAICSALLLPLLWLFIHRLKKGKTPSYVNLAVLKSRKAIIGYMFMVIVMFFSSSSYLVTSYTTSVLKLDSIHSNGLNLMMIPGFVLGATLCFWWFRWQIWRFRVLVFWGMACFVGYFGILYLGITPDGSYEFLYLPTMLRGTGMMILLIAFGVYAVEDMDPRLMISNAFFLVGIRSLLAPVVCSSFFSNLIYRYQQHNIMILSENIDIQNSIPAMRYDESLNEALHHGFSLDQAQQIATNSLYASVSTQSLILSIKIVLGYMLLFSIVLMIISRFIPFHKTLRVQAVKSGYDMA